MMTTKGVISTDPLGVAGRAMVVNRFTSLRDNDKGSRITRPPLSWSGRATCRPFGDGGVSTDPSPLATSVLPPRLNETLHHFMASMTVTKGVISTTPLGVAGRATCRPFGDGLVSTHPIPFGNISLTAKTERNTSPFHGLHDGDKGGGFNPHPFARQAEPWLLAVSRVFMMTTKGVVLRDPLCRGQAEPPVEPFGDGVISTDTIPSGNLSLTAKTERKRNVRRFTSLHDDEGVSKLK